jgi:hypothetical protein
MAASLDESIESNAQGPSEAEQDGRRVKQHALPDQIAADRYLAGKAASRSKGLGIKRTRTAPPGALG